VVIVSKAYPLILNLIILLRKISTTYVSRFLNVSCARFCAFHHIATNTVNLCLFSVSVGSTISSNELSSSSCFMHFTATSLKRLSFMIFSALCRFRGKPDWIKNSFFSNYVFGSLISIVPYIKR